MGNTQQSKRETHPENSKEKEEDSSFTCEICIEPMSQSKRFKNKKRCTHPFCFDCIAKYIEVKVEDHITEVKCPGFNCEKLLDPLSCCPILSPQVFEKWCDVLCNAAILSFDKVYCPFNHCSTLILNECKDDNEKTECPNCKNLFCFKCKSPWHEGFQCSENGELKDTNDILFAKLAERKKWKRCPSCNHAVELLSGCPDVKCRCGTRFCYICGGKCSNHLRWCERNVNSIRLRTIIFLIFILVLTSIAVPFLLGKLRYS
ncbi:probable E3 ubiquitin-protein ligase RNF217 [Macadamia integrifolia]|uniref:probable E3 ubiquitin-protein ligase RNF217 n=1 Tax=Macadamia integrifolia TaxID=60698 RepID=UPI001C4F4950|nr:probable E3 ubiquitin-protein ligase RNF217 [Macadamia integrifolia]